MISKTDQSLPKAEKKDADWFAETFDVSRETMMSLSAYVDALTHWQRTTNLIAPETLPAIWHRHIGDSAQLIRMAPGVKKWADIGTGAGLPGMVIGILLTQKSTLTL